ncbi:MAG: 6-phosphofructokinase [Firmicutes bacterium]|nr:6-phosphofructokinase [Bacillota bacterium]
MKGNLLVAHGGGPTAVINASLYGVISEAKKHSAIENIYGARYGIEGVINEEFIDLSKQNARNIELLPHTPASAIGSCRYKISDEDYNKLLEVFKKYNIRYFFYNGGNDSMDTCNKVAKLADSSNYEMKVIGIPKTIDNDLTNTDHCPGFGSAARYAAVSAMELKFEAEALPIHVIVFEIMGRNAGWLAASAMLGGADLIYLPERPFEENKFLADVENLHKRKKGILVAVSEGLVDESGKSLADTGFKDNFGHTVPGGVAQHLSDSIIRNTGIKSRAEKPGLLGRASIALQSAVDRKEAIEVGKRAVIAAIKGESAKMVSIKRASNNPYIADYALVPLKDAANAERKFPIDWINENGNGIKKEFSEYCLPLIGGALPEYARLDNTLITKER